MDVILRALPVFVVKLHRVLHPTKFAGMGVTHLLGLCFVFDIILWGYVMLQNRAFWKWPFNLGLWHTNHESKIFPVLEYGFVETLSNFRLIPKLLRYISHITEGELLTDLRSNAKGLGAVSLFVHVFIFLTPQQYTDSNSCEPAS